MSYDKMPHSGHYFGDQRDYWWNYDFLKLMSARWDLDRVHSMLDVGCGIGHWGLILERFLPEGANVYGIDAEAKWIEKATQRAFEKDLNDRFHYKVGIAENIPFEDNYFDMVTCQTLLIHVPDVDKVLQEMLRVLKPGGLLTVVEPNNIAPSLVFNNQNINEPIDSLLENIRFHIMCERGKKKLGLGYNSIGDILPHHFAQLQLQNIQVYLSDKTSTLIPPYPTKEEKVLIKQIEDWGNQEIVVWPKSETKKYFMAGGGSEPEFNRIWSILLEGKNELIEDLKNKTISLSGAAIMYLISGRK